MDPRLLEILVCPICKGPLKLETGSAPGDGSFSPGVATHTELICKADGLAYPIRDGIPVMLVDEARKLQGAVE